MQARLYNVGGFRMMHMHNAAMSAIVNLGLAGTALYLLFCMAIYRRVSNLRTQRIRIVLLGAVTALLLNTLTMESITAPLSIPWIAHAMFFATVAFGLWEQSEMRRLPRRQIGAREAVIA